MQFTPTQVKQTLEKMLEPDITEEYVIELTNSINESLLSPKFQDKILTTLIEHINNLSKPKKKGSIVWT